MEVDRITRAAAHFAAARRLGDRIKYEPELRGLGRCARFHIGEAANLAREMCDGRAANPRRHLA